MMNRARIVDRIAGHVAAGFDALAERLGRLARSRTADDSRGGRKRLGDAGERMAARHLRRRGYRIVARNFRDGGGEIDLVAMDGETLVFVEVKTRRDDAAGAPLEAVDARKQERLRRAAQAFAARHRAARRAMRFDVVAISGSGRSRRIELIQDAF
jgi:putative endonuclease